MQARISEALGRIQSSPLFGMLAKAAALKAAGQPVISLSAGEPDFDTPVHIIDAAEQAMRSGHTRYTPVAGTTALRQAVCNKLKTENQLDYTLSQILVTTGAKQALFNLCIAVLNPGDEVIVLRLIGQAILTWCSSRVLQLWWSTAALRMAFASRHKICKRRSRHALSCCCSIVRAIHRARITTPSACKHWVKC